MSFQIAIDGPVASGKGTVARLVAERLDMLYIDTGAMYRAVAFAAKQNGVSFKDEDTLVELIQRIQIELRQPAETEKDGRLTTVLLDGEDISWAIRTEEMSSGSSQVAALAGVRQALVKLQQEIAMKQDVVMEGRDITYRVLPNAQLKVFLTASVEQRAQRRLVDLQHRGHDTTYEQVYKDLEERDERDSNRAADPLQVVEGVWVLDTTHMTIAEAVEDIVKRVQMMRE
jgi:CMP/dCMP kinase